MSLCILPTQAHWLVLTYFGAFVMSKTVTCLLSHHMHLCHQTDYYLFILCIFLSVRAAGCFSAEELPQPLFSLIILLICFNYEFASCDFYDATPRPVTWPTLYVHFPLFPAQIHPIKSLHHIT